jgi:hypothetical protein
MPDLTPHEAAKAYLDDYTGPIDSDGLKVAYQMGAKREREACAIRAANAVAIELHIWHSFSAAEAERVGAVIADAIRACGTTGGKGDE